MNTIEFSKPYLSGGNNSSSATSCTLPSLIVGPYRSSVPHKPQAAACVRPLLDTPSSNAAIGYVNIMKGTPPASPDDMKSYAAYTQDILVSFNTRTSSTTFQPTLPLLSGNIVETPTIELATVYNQADLSGEATWVWICTRQATSTTTYTDVIYHSVIGTIGNMSSGADLVIPNVNVVKGKLYRIVGLKITIPLTLSY